MIGYSSLSLDQHHVSQMSYRIWSWLITSCSVVIMADLAKNSAGHGLLNSKDFGAKESETNLGQTLMLNVTIAINKRPKGAEMI